MRKVKWIFFLYLSLVSLLAVALGVSLSISTPRDPRTLYNVYLANLKSLDPAVCNDTVGSAIIANVYECLYGYEYPVKPYKLYPQLAAEMPNVSVDDYTIQIKLVKPAPQMRFQLAHGGSSIVSRAADQYWSEKLKDDPMATGLNKHCIGTGPYMMAENLEDQRIVFVANPSYRGRP